MLLQVLLLLLLLLLLSLLLLWCSKTFCMLKSQKKQHRAQNI